MALSDVILAATLNNLAERYKERVAMPMPSPSTNGCWRSTRRRTAPITPMWPWH